MSEEETIFSSKIGYGGIFSFAEFYKFLYDWVTEEADLDVAEDKYKEKLAGDTKTIEGEWTATKKVTDYFKFKVKIEFKGDQIKEVEIVQGGAKIKTNQGKIELKVKGTLIRDWEGKFEKTAFQKFMRAIYEKWVIPSRVKEFEDRIISRCNGILEQSKAWLDLEGRQS